MSRRMARVFLSLLVLAITAFPAAAEVYHIRLHNGSVFDTTVQPEQSSWDPNVVLVLSDVGNWIGLDQRDIDRVDTESQVRGFGIAINNTTIAIGWAPNDAAEAQPQGPTSAADQAMQQMLQMQQAAAHYTVQQGVSAEQTQGIPPSLVGYGAGALGAGGYPGGVGGGGARPPAVAPSIPTPVAPVAPTTPTTPPGGAS
jgi:hypothetical protein